MKRKIWAISDTHGLHEELKVPTDVDTVIHTGDGGTYRNPGMNEKPFRNFLGWFNDLKIENKIYSPGNHDTAFAAKYIEEDEYPRIQFLVNEVTMLENNLLYASPYTPSFGEGWAYNMGPVNITANWESVPDLTNILLTHGPAFEILDETSQKRVGCFALSERIAQLKHLKLHIFGHIHDEYEHANYGIYLKNGITHVNAAVVSLRHDLVNNGHIISI